MTINIEKVIVPWMDDPIEVQYSDCLSDITPNIDHTVGDYVFVAIVGSGEYYSILYAATQKHEVFELALIESGLSSENITFAQMYFHKFKPCIDSIFLAKKPPFEPNTIHQLIHTIIATTREHQDGQLPITVYWPMETKPYRNGWYYTYDSEKDVLYRLHWDDQAEWYESQEIV